MLLILGSINFHSMKLSAILLNVLLTASTVPVYLIVVTANLVSILILLLTIVLLYVLMASFQMQSQSYAKHVIQNVITVQQVQLLAQTA